MSAARQYHTRTPRYVLKAEDESLMRFAGMETKGIAYRARVRDLSATGFAFVVGGAEPPEEGEVLKIEFTVPGRGQIACFATVIRVDRREDWDPEIGTREQTLVACQYRNLPSLHARSIELSLKSRTSSEGEYDWESDRRKHAVALAGLSLILVLCMSFLAQSPAFWISTVRSLLG